MQTPKTRVGSLEVPKRTSPVKPSAARQLKASGGDSESNSSPHPASRTPKSNSPKVIERRSPRTSVTELQKKRPVKVSELETQLAQLQEELKKAKEQVASSESSKRRSQQEAEEAKKQLAAMSMKLKESEQQMMEISSSEDDRVQELRKLSQERDRAWESELEAVRKQHSLDNAALASAMNEIQKLKIQLERVSESKAAQVRHAESADDEIHSLRLELDETLSLVKEMKNELHQSKESEIRAEQILCETQKQLEMAKSTEERLRSEGLEAMEAYKSLVMELEKSEAQIKFLEGLVGKLQSDQSTESSKNSADPLGCTKLAPESGENEEANQLKTELDHAKFEVSQLRSALDGAERRYQEEYIQTTLQIRSAFELVEQTKSESCRREAEMEAKLKQAKADIDELKAELMAKETKLMSISKEKEGLNSEIGENQSLARESALEFELKKSEAHLADLKLSLSDKEKELQCIIEENEKLKMEISKKETEKSIVNDEAVAVAEAAKAAEREALIKLGNLTEEADKSSDKVARVTEQLDAVQAANSEMEAELRRLKVQSDQWRKAAEAAAAMLTTGNNGKFVERTGSLDGNYHTIGGKLGSPLSEDMDDDSPKKKNGNMLKKIGVLLKKGQK